MAHAIRNFILSTRSGALLEASRKPAGYSIEAMRLDPCGCVPGACSLLPLANKHGCYPRSRKLCRHRKEPSLLHARAGVRKSITPLEAAIAHILNAEGEKPQKAIQYALCLEQVPLSKLDALQSTRGCGAGPPPRPPFCGKRQLAETALPTYEPPTTQERRLRIESQAPFYQVSKLPDNGFVI